MKKIKAWWKKVNTPFYKRSLYSLVKDEKKDKQKSMTNFIMLFIFYILIILVIWAFVELSGAIVNLDIGIGFKLVIVLMAMQTVIIFFIFILVFLVNCINTGDLQNSIKHLSTQLKVMEVEQNNKIVFKRKDLDGSMLKKEGETCQKKT